MYSRYLVAKLKYNSNYYIMFKVSESGIHVLCDDKSFGTYCFSSDYNSLYKLCQCLKNVYKEKIGKELQRDVYKLCQELFGHVRMFYEAANAEKLMTFQTLLSYGSSQKPFIQAIIAAEDIWNKFKYKKALEASMGEFPKDWNSIIFQDGWYIRNAEVKAKYKNFALSSGKYHTIEPRHIDYWWDV